MLPLVLNMQAQVLSVCSVLYFNCIYPLVLHCISVWFDNVFCASKASYRIFFPLLLSILLIYLFHRSYLYG